MSFVTFNTAASGIDAAQVAMDTIAQNLSNANTPGYVTETANLVTNPGGDPLGVGSGVRAVNVSQPSDQLLLNAAQQAQGALSQSTALQQTLQQAQLAFPEPSSTGLSADLSNFWQAWDQIASNPSSSAGRQQVVDSAQNVVTDLQQASAQIQTTTQNANAQLSTVIGSVNTLLQQVASLNGQITTSQATGGSPNNLIDQRNQLMNQLSSQIGATGTLRPDGSLQVTVQGSSLVIGTSASQLTTQSSGGKVQLELQSSLQPLTVTSGTAAGLITAVNSYLPSYQNQLDGVANGLASLVNGQLSSGYTATGASGASYPLFTGSGASGLQVNPAVTSNLSLIAASSTSVLPDATNNGANAQKMADLYNSGGGPDALYRQLVEQVGNQVSVTNNQVQAQTSVANAAQTNLQSVTGVNTNDQLVSLMNFQNAYQAAAKVITSAETAVQSLLSAV